MDNRPGYFVYLASKLKCCYFELLQYVYNHPKNDELIFAMGRSWADLLTWPAIVLVFSMKTLLRYSTTQTID